VLRKLLGFRPGSDDPIETAFGVLERDVLRVLWADGNLSVREVQSRLERPVAYTTVMTTLDRLFKKGVLRRRQDGRAFLYSPAVTPQDLRASIAGHVLSSILRSSDAEARPVLSNLVESVGEQEGAQELLQTLESLIREKRRSLGKTPPRPLSGRRS
jgi:predicted transcriptional regulator